MAGAADDAALMLPPEDQDLVATNLHELHADFESIERWDIGHFTAVFEKVRTLKEAIHGKVIQYRWIRTGRPDCLVAGKKMLSASVCVNRERQHNDKQAHMNPLGPPPVGHIEDPLIEIGVLRHVGKLPNTPRSLLRMVGLYVVDEHTVALTEFCPNGELFDVIQGPLWDPIEDNLRSCMWQLLQAVRYLHHHCIGHRDISLENTLVDLSSGRYRQLRIMDFGQAVRTCYPGGANLRYYLLAGKPYYRPAECYVPQEAEVRVRLPANAAVGDVIMVDHRGYYCEVLVHALHVEPVVAGEMVAAQVHGYAVPPMDVFALGVCLFIMTWRVPPWRRCMMVDQAFSFCRGKGYDFLVPLLKAYKKPMLSSQAMELLSRMLQIGHPGRRPSAEECLSSDWFLPMSGVPVPLCGEQSARVGP